MKANLGGYRAERMLEAWLRSAGYKSIDRRKGAPGLFRKEDGDGKETVFTKSRDVFGCIDLIAINDDMVWFIQVTTDAGRPFRKRKIAMRCWPRHAMKQDCVRVSIFTHKAKPSALDGRKLDHFWRIDDYIPIGVKSWDWKKKGLFAFDINRIAIKRKTLSKKNKLRAAEMVRAIHGDVEAAGRLSEKDRLRVDRIVRRQTKKADEASLEV